MSAATCSTHRINGEAEEASPNCPVCLFVMEESMSLRNILSISVLMVASAAFASADPILFDDFNYPIGPLDGQNGGIGWAGSWVGIPEYVVAPGSLSYCDGADCLAQSGNRAQFVPSSLAGTNSLRTLSSLGSNGSTFWLSFLISFDGTLAQNTANVRLDGKNGDLYVGRELVDQTNWSCGGFRIGNPVHSVLRCDRSGTGPFCRDAH